jgi:alpha,alpha-trehalase
MKFFFHLTIIFWAGVLIAGAATNVKTTLEQLLTDEDTDNDKKITIDDPHIAGTQRGDKRFWLELNNGQKYEISGTYYLSNLLQELSLASESGKETAESFIYPTF